MRKSSKPYETVREREKKTKRNFEDGQQVMVKIGPQKQKKDAFRFEGPFEIIKHISPHQLEIQNLTDGRRIRRRIGWLKKI